MNTIQIKREAVFKLFCLCCLICLWRYSLKNEEKTASDREFERFLAAYTDYEEQLTYSINSPRLGPEKEMKIDMNCIRQLTRPDENPTSDSEDSADDELEYDGSTSYPLYLMIRVALFLVDIFKMFYNLDSEYDNDFQLPCEYQTPTQFCTVLTKQPTNNSLSFECHTPSQCKPSSLSVGFVGIDGFTIWENKTVEKLEQKLASLSQNSSFAFVQCILLPRSRQSSKNYSNEQFINFAKTDAKRLITKNLINRTRMKSEKTKNEDLSSGKISITLLMLDSVSRPSFYSNLLLTQKAMRDINHDKSSGYRVLDFEAMNSMYNRTFENIAHLFGPNFTGYSESVDQMPVGVLYSEFKSRGYVTMYMDDMCWLGNWGMVKTMRSYLDIAYLDNDKEGLRKDLDSQLQVHSVDSRGVTDASCRFLWRVGHRSHPFSSVNICLNGRNQIDYFLEYLFEYETTLHDSKTPYIHYFENDVAHETSSKRIKTMDAPLANYLRQTVEQKRNSVVFVFADHGTTRSRPRGKTTLGYDQVINPAMFMLIPPSLQKQMSSGSFEKLIAAQKKLQTLSDFRDLIHCILHQNFSSSNCSFLASPLENSRSCNDVKLHDNSAKCICDNVQDSRLRDPDLKLELSRKSQKYFRRMLRKTRELQTCRSNLYLTLQAESTKIIQGEERVEARGVFHIANESQNVLYISQLAILYMYDSRRGSLGVKSRLIYFEQFDPVEKEYSRCSQNMTRNELLKCFCF